MHWPHELFYLRYELGHAWSCGEFGERRQLLNLRSDTQVHIVDWVQLLLSFQEVAPVGALPDSGLNLPLKEFRFARLFDLPAFSPDITVLLTREKQTPRKIFSSFRQVFGIEPEEVDLKVRRSDGLPSPPWDVCVTCTT